VDRTFPNGRVVGVDIIPAQPPRGVSTIQGNFLSPSVQEEVRLYVQETGRGRPKRRRHLGGTNCNEEAVTVEELDESSTDYIELEKQSLNSSRGKIDEGGFAPATDHMLEGKEKLGEKVVDVVLSDMSAPWVQPSVSWNKSLSDPYNRMINTSGTAFRDHAGSMVGRLNVKAARFLSVDTGPMCCCVTLCIRYSQDWRPLRLQILSRRRRQGPRKTITNTVCEGASRET